jgi:hypothetical protein
MKRATGFIPLLAAVAVWCPTAIAQTPGGPVTVTFGWPATDRPQQIILPNEGTQLALAGVEQASTQLTRPAVGERRYAVEVLYADGTSYPLELRLLPISRPATIQLSRNRPDSCPNNNLLPFEAHTANTISSIRAAFSVQFMLSRATEANSCASWPLRAQKARHDRYCHMMAASEILVVPEAVRAQFRSDAQGRTAYLQAIDKCERDELARKAGVLQATVTADAKPNPLNAYIASAALSEEAAMAEADPAVDARIVYSQITQPALVIQTRDMRAIAVREVGEAAVLAVDQSIAAAPR